MADESTERTSAEFEPEVDQLLDREPSAPDAGAPEIARAEPSAGPTGPGEGVPSADERLGRALATIEALQGEVASLRDHALRSSVEPRIQQAPSAEAWLEVLGTRIAKDPGARPIKITQDDLLRLGWNEDPAGTINVLANVFYDVISTRIPAQVFRALSDAGTETQQVQARQGDFWTQYPDLRDHADLCQMFDLRLWNSGAGRGRSQRDYNDLVAGNARQAIARMRGQTVEQYTASLATQQPPGSGPGGQPRSRQVTGAATTSRGGRPVNLSEQEKEMLDLMQG